MLVKTQSSTVSLRCRLSAGSHNYTDALSKAVLFFEGQRSGKLPAGQRIPWRSDSGLSTVLLPMCDFLFLFSISCFPVSDHEINLNVNLTMITQVDLVGRYYDAGDNVKFGCPMLDSWPLSSPTQRLP